MSGNDELNKILYGTGLPEPKIIDGIQVEDIPSAQQLQDDAWADPLRTEGASTDPNFNISYGDEEFSTNLKKLYELKSSHPDVRRFLNKQTDENERFSHGVVFNPDAYPVHEAIRKPTQLEWTEMSEMEKTEVRRKWFLDNKAAAEKVSRSIGDLVKSDFKKTMRLLSEQSVGDYNKLLKAPDKAPKQEFVMIQPQEEPLAAVISKVEGTDERAKAYGYNSGYDVTLEYGKFDPEWFNSKEKPLTDLTVQDVLKVQTAMLKHPENNLNSSAVGKWQLTRRTFRDIINRKLVDIKPTDKFTPELQDKIFYALLEKRGYSKYRRGEMPKSEFLQGLKDEWEGLLRFRSNIEDVLEGLERTT